MRGNIFSTSITMLAKDATLPTPAAIHYPRMPQLHTATLYTLHCQVVVVFNVNIFVTSIGAHLARSA